MRTTPRTLAAFVASTALLTFAGCGDGDPPKAAPFTPTGHIETPSPSPSDDVPTEPALPDAATQPTEDGARAFIAYYWDLINYAQVTGHVSPLKKISGDRCDGCYVGIDAIRGVYKSGGYVTAGNYVENITFVEPYKPAPDVVAFHVEVAVDVDEHRAVDSSGATTVYPAGRGTYSVYVLWGRAGWRLDVMTGD